MAEIDDVFADVPISEQDDIFSNVPVNIETPTKTTLDLETGKIIGAPHYMNTDMVKYYDAVQNDNEPDSNFFGYVRTGMGEVAEKLGAIARGSYTTAANISTEGGAGFRLQYADAYKESMKGYPARSDLFSKIVYALDPFALPEKMARTNAGFAKLFLTKDQIQQKELGVDEIIAAADELRQRHSEWLQTSLIPQTDDTVEQVFFDVGGAVTTSLASIGLGVLTKNPMASIMLMGSIQKNSAYLEARDKGMSLESAQEISSLMGSIEGGLELVGFDKIMGLVEGDKVIKNALKYFVIEAMQEGSQTLGEEVIAQTSGLRDVDIERAGQDILYSMLIGGLAGGLGGGVIETLKGGQNIGKDGEIINKRYEELTKTIERRIASVISDQAKKFNPDDATVKKVGDIMSKFVNGIDINIEEEIRNLSGITDQKKNELIDSIKNKTLRSVSEDVLNGRVSLIDEQIAALDNKWDTIERKSQATQEEVSRSIDLLKAQADKIRESGGKGIKALERKIDEISRRAERLRAKDVNEISKLIEKRDELDANRAGILTREEGSVEINDALNKQIKLKGRDALDLGLSKVDGVVQGLRRARKIYESDSKGAQKIIVQAINNSGLSAKDKSKFLTSVTNITSSEKLLSDKAEKRQIDVLSHRIQKAVEAAQREKLKETVNATLDKFKERKSGKRPKGKTLDFDVQSFFDTLRSANNLGVDEAADKLRANIDAGKSDIETLYENKILALKSVYKMQSPKILADLALDLNAIANDAKTFTTERVDARKNRRAELRARAINQLLKGKDIREVDDGVLNRAIVNRIKKAEGLYSAIQSSWQALMDLPFGNDKALSDELNNIVIDGLRKKRNIAVSYEEKLMKAAETAFNIKSRRKLYKKFIIDNKPVNLGKFVYAGEEKSFTWNISRAEARKIWMMLQNEGLKQDMMSPRKSDSGIPTGNGFTEEMINALYDPRLLTDQEIEFAKAQMNIYKELYPIVNKVYEEQNGISLPSGDNYVPTIRKHQSNMDAPEFMRNLENHITSASPSFLKSRTDTANEFIIEPDVLTMKKYISGASNYVGMSETVGELKAIFADNQVHEAISKTYGNTFYDAVQNHIDDFARGGIRRDESFFNFLHGVNGRVAKSLIYGKPNMFLKQMTAQVAYAAEIPLDRYIAGTFDFMANPIKAIKILSKSDLMKERGASQDVNTMKNAHTFTENPNLVYHYKKIIDDSLAIYTLLGDRAAIYAGGWSVYKYNIDILGKTHEEAMIAFEEATKRTQQDINLDQRTRLQASPNAVVRTITMFMSSQSKFLEREVEAVRHWMRGQITTRDMAKKLFIYHIILPVFFQYVANAFDEDDDEGSLVRAAVLGSFNGLFILGDAAAYVLAAAYDVHYKPQAQKGFLLMLGDVFEEMSRINKKGFEADDFFSTLGLVVGLPIKAGINTIEGVQDIEEGDTYEGTLRALGWTERTAEKASK